MAIRIPNVGTPINFGEVELKSADWNDSFEYLIKQTVNSYRQGILNLIRQLEDRVVTFNGAGGEWAEAYTSASGRLDSVDTIETNCGYISSKYIPGFEDRAGSDTLHNPNNFTNPSNAFDGNELTSAELEISSSGTTVFGTTFSSASDIDILGVNVSGNVSRSTGTRIITIDLQLFNGSTWVTHSTLYTRSEEFNYSYSFSGQVVLNENTQGVRISFSNNSLNTVYNRVNILKYGESSIGDIVHDIPTGTFPSNISSSVGTPKVVDFEDGANIQYKYKFFVPTNTLAEIKAASLDENAFIKNNCNIFKVSSDTWLVYVPSGLGYTEQEEEARIINTLYCSTPGSPTSSGVPECALKSAEGLTSVKISTNRYVGKKVFLNVIHLDSNNNGTRTLTGTFTNTADNQNTMIVGAALTGASTIARINFPTGTVFVEHDGVVGSAGSDVKLLTDNSSFDTDNPSSMTLEVIRDTVAAGARHAKALSNVFLNEGEITYTQSGSNITVHTEEITESIPKPELLDKTPYENMVIETDWLNVNQIEKFDPITPNQCIVRLIPKEIDPTPGVPSISGFGVVSDTRYL